MQRLGFLFICVVVASGLVIASNEPAQAQATEPTSIQAIYALPSDQAAVAGRQAAAAVSLQVVEDWFAGQTGGEYPVFNEVSGSIDVRLIVLSKTKAQLDAYNYGAMTSLLQTEVEAAFPGVENSRLFVYLEGPQSAVGACGYTSGMIVIPMENCGGIYPSSSAQFPYGDTYLAAHELTHMLGAVPSCAPNYLPGAHLDGDNRDILFQGSGGRDWSNLMLDPGNDDYYNHNNAGCPDIKDSPLLGTWETNQPDTPITTTSTTTTTTTTTVPSGPAFCDGLEATIVGTSGDDVLNGTVGVDIIAGLQGNDTIRGYGGDDIICGGRGNDTIFGGAGFDIIYGAQGNDVIYAANGKTDPNRMDVRGARIFAGAGDDTVYGSNRWDRMQGGVGADRLYGYEGRDWMRGGANNDLVDGGSNIDDLHGGNGNDHIFIDNEDTVRGGAGASDRCTQTATANPALLRSCELS